jgi:hypothetical protein
MWVVLLVVLLPMCLDYGDVIVDDEADVDVSGSVERSFPRGSHEGIFE